MFDKLDCLIISLLSGRGRHDMIYPDDPNEIGYNKSYKILICNKFDLIKTFIFGETADDI